MPSWQPRHYKKIFFFLIGIVLILAYHNSLKGTFLFDDFGNIVGNTNLELSTFSLPEIKKVFSPNQNCPNRKIAHLSFALNYYFGQLNPVGFHFVNILIHIINAWLIFSLLQWYFQKIPYERRWNPVVLSGLAALWWATNPIQTNAVTYIVQRMTSLSTLFCMVSLLCYLRARQPQASTPSGVPSKRLLFAIIAVLSWLFALMSKEIAAILPVLIVVHEIYFFNLFSKFKAQRKKYLSGMLLLCSLFIGEVFFFMGSNFLHGILNGYSHRNFTLTERILTEPRVAFHYIGLFLYPLPTRLRLYYDSFPISDTIWFPPSTLLALAGTLLWLVAIIVLFKRHKLLSFGLLWVFLCLLIESTVIPLELVFEHRFYLPSIGFVLAATAAIPAIFRKTKIQPIFFYGCLGLLIFSQILGTINRNRTWGNALEFSIDEVQKNPNSVRAWTNLGWFLIREGHPTVADQYLQKALILSPDNIVVLNNLFSIYNNAPNRKPIIAETYLQKIFSSVKNGKAKPTDTETLSNLSHHLFKNERYEESLLLLQEESKFYAGPEVFLHIGQCHLKLGQYKKAISVLEHALQLEPNNPEMLYYTALGYQQSGDTDMVQSLLSKIKVTKVQDKTLQDNILLLQNSLYNTTP